MNSLQGHFLVAAPHQLDPNFAETVILVVAHTERGAMGVIVNRPKPHNGRPHGRPGDRNRRQIGEAFYFGGPVAGPVMALHADPSLADIAVLPGVFFSGSKRSVLSVIRGRSRPCKLLVGYVGWGPKQLEYEVEIGVWRVAPGTAEQTFSRGKDLWHQLRRRRA